MMKIGGSDKDLIMLTFCNELDISSGSWCSSEFEQINSVSHFHTSCIIWIVKFRGVGWKQNSGLSYHHGNKSTAFHTLNLSAVEGIQKGGCWVQRG